MKVEVKSVRELVEAGQITEVDVQKFSHYWQDSVALIFAGEAAAEFFVRAVLLPKVGREKLMTIWSCLIGPAESDIFTSKPKPFFSEHERWLLFKYRDYCTFIKQAVGQQ